MNEVMRKNIIDVDLSKPLKTEQYGMLIASKDSNANMIGVNVLDNGSVVNLSGCSVIGYFQRPDGHVEMLTGVTSGNRAIVILNANCYLVSGHFKLSIKVCNTSGLMVTVRIVNGFVYAAVPEDYAAGDGVPDAPVAVTLYVDDEGNATLMGYIPSVDGDGDAIVS